MAQKIGILTYHHVVNPGAVLQAYSTVELFKAHFPLSEVEIIDYRPLNTEIRDLMFGFLSTKNPALQLRRASHFLCFRKFVNKRLPLSKPRIVTNSYSDITKRLVDKYDLIAVGSDEIWKIETTRFSRTFPNIYFLADSIKAKQISFAASASSLKFKELSMDAQQWMSSRLSAFDLISVRDDHTVGMMNHLGVDRKIAVRKVPDPTFYLEITEDCKNETREYLEDLGVDFEKPLFGITFFDQRMPKAYFDSLRNKGYQVIALSVYHPLADINLMGKLDPLQWASVYGFLSLCFTNLFHGAIFSLKNLVPFLCFDYNRAIGYQAKLECLLNDFGLQKLLFDGTNGFPKAEELDSKVRLVLSDDNSESVKHGLMLRRQEIDMYMQEIERLMK